MSKLKTYEVELVMVLPVHTEVTKLFLTQAKDKEDAERKLINMVLSSLTNEKYLLANDYWYATDAVIRWNLHGLKEVNE